jgi:ferredoxin
MTDLGDRYFFKAITDKGKALLSAEYFKEATAEDRKQRKEDIQQVENALPQEMDLSKISGAIPEKYNDDLWDEFSEMCLTCGACNMVCPTCHCFTINDKTNLDRTQGTRVLVWDSCHFERFAKMAGDLNIRKEKSSRFKHRLYDKFYYDEKRSGSIFCVGCGRCLEFCPSHIDIREALKKVQEVS